MKISFCFQGWVSSADIDKVMMTSTGKEVPINQLPFSDEEIINGLEDGRIAISLEDTLNNCKKCEVEIHDYESP